MKAPASFYIPLQDGKVKCELCIRGCVIEKGKRGACRVRVNEDGKLYSLIYGEVSTYSVEYVEKIPLYMYYPNQQFLTLGSAGCNLSCDFCLTWNITQVLPEEVEVTPLKTENIVESAKALGCTGVCYTHSEPTLNLEYYLEIMKAVEKAGLKNVFATNGLLSENVLDEILKYVDAFALTFKGKESFYSKYCSADVPKEHLLKIITKIKEKKKHLELVYVLIPDLNDDEESLSSLAELSLHGEAPVILLRFFPSYKLDKLEATPEESLEKALNYLYSKGVENVFMENIFSHPGKNIYCASCKDLLVEREGYGVVKWNLETRGSENYCKNCGTKSKVVGSLGKFA